MKARFISAEAGYRDHIIPERYVPGRRKPWRWQRRLIPLFLGGPLLFFAAKLLYSSAQIQAPGFVEQQQLTLRTASQGYVDQIYVKVLDEVAAGQPVARLANDALAIHAEQLRAALKQLQDAATIGPSHGASGAAVWTRILALQAELSDLDSQLQAMVVRAPEAGRIVDLAAVKGDQLSTGGRLAMLAPQDGEMHIDVYIPPSHANYALPGTHADVIFPDGMRRGAVVADVPEAATLVPKAQSALLGDAGTGVYVRMQFLDAADATQRPLTDGLPVQVEFESGWDLNGPRQLALQIARYWSGLKDSLLPRSA